MNPWLETDNLRLEHDGLLYVKSVDADGDVRWSYAGHVLEDPRVPDRLDAELRDAVDLWRDGLRNDEQASWRADYWRMIGLAR
jgi:hypothetical protein